MEDVPESLVTIIRPQMFPPAPEEAAKYNLNKCIRFVIKKAVIVEVIMHFILVLFD